MGSFRKNIGKYWIFKKMKISSNTKAKGRFYQKNNSDNLK